MKRTTHFNSEFPYFNFLFYQSHEEQNCRAQISQFYPLLSKLIGFPPSCRAGYLCKKFTLKHKKERGNILSLKVTKREKESFLNRNSWNQLNRKPFSFKDLPNEHAPHLEINTEHTLSFPLRRLGSVCTCVGGGWKRVAGLGLVGINTCNIEIFITRWNDHSF